MDNDNPYKAPQISGPLPPGRPDSRLRTLIDVFGTVGAGFPIVLRFVVLFMDGQSITDVFLICYFSLVFVLWAPSLVINIAGAFSLRPLSFVGLLLNFLSVGAHCVAQG